MCSRRARDVATQPRLVLSLALIGAPLSCIPSLALAPVQESATQPANVTIDFHVTTREGEPVTGLRPDQFGVFEDAKRIVAPPGRALLSSAKDGTGDHYVVSYCSPARGGPHEVRIFAHAKDRSMGELVYAFSADGFGPGCEAGSPPTPETDAAHASPVPAVAEKKVDKKPPKPKKPPEAPASPTAITVPPPSPTPPAPDADPFAP